MSTEAPPVPSLAWRDELLDQVAVPGLDLDAARGQVEQLRRGRRRTRRAAGCGAGVVALLLAAVLVWPSQDDPDQLLAERDDRRATTSTTTSVPTSTSTAPAAVAPTSTAVPATLAPTTAPPTTVATTTTLPPNQPLQAQLRLPSVEVAPGAPVALEVVWSDADHAGVVPVLVVDWGDPALVEALTVPGTASCERPGAPGGGTLARTFRYATPGVHTVRVRLSTCEGAGAYAETVELVGSVRVGPARSDGAAGRVVLAVLTAQADAPAVPPLDAAQVTYVPSDPSLVPLQLAPREPVLAQFSTSPLGLTTVLVLPADAEGALELTWPDSTCRATAAVSASSASVQTVSLARTC